MLIDASLMRILREYYDGRRYPSMQLVADNFDNSYSNEEIIQYSEELHARDLIAWETEADEGGEVMYWEGKINANGIRLIENGNMQENQTQSATNFDSIILFISHSEKDIDLAKALVRLIREALKIDRRRIRCTSVPGHKLEPGVHTSIAIRTELNDANLVLGLITQNSLRSSYVLFELGAGWALEKAWALLGPDCDYADIPNPLHEHSALKLSNSNDVSRLIDAVRQRTGCEGDDHEVVSNSIADFLEIVEKWKE